MLGHSSVLDMSQPDDKTQTQTTSSIRPRALARVFRWTVAVGTAGVAMNRTGLVPGRATAFGALALLLLPVGYLVFDRTARPTRGAMLADVLLSTMLLVSSLAGFYGWPLDFRALLFPEAASYGRFDPVARIDRATWPRRLDTALAFDEASRAEIAMFALAVDDGEARPWAGPSGASVERWLAAARARVLANFEQARATCTPGALLCPPGAVASWEDLVSFARASTAALPPDFRHWRYEARAFHAAYLTERLRLASSPVSSEAFAIDDSEILGDGFPDKAFLLTLDDGPSPKGGSTDETLDVVRRHGRSALCFLVGRHVRERLRETTADELRQLYAGSCIGGHGMEHVRHSEWPEAASTFAPLREELARIGAGAGPLFFRPPYGERSAATVSALAANGFRDMLWNIDSRDWRDDVDSRDAAARSVTLMLLWRRGIILFHDAYPRAKDALPILWRDLEGSGIRWLKCGDLDPASPSGLVGD
jgi:peptidoglycan/xylan/chitin deacetylase (PgdA/CDA1 family)